MSKESGFFKLKSISSKDVVNIVHITRKDLEYPLSMGLVPELGEDFISLVGYRKIFIYFSGLLLLFFPFIKTEIKVNGCLVESGED